MNTSVSNIDEHLPEADIFMIEDMSLLRCIFTPNKWYKWIVYHRREIVSILTIFVVIGVDIGVTDLEDLFGLCGSLGLSFICYIFPCIIYLSRMHQTNKLKWFSIKTIFSIFILLFSIFVMIYSTAVIIINIIQS